MLIAGVGTASGQTQSAPVFAPASAASGLTILPGHIHKFAQARFDTGEAPSSLRLSGLELIIAKTPAQQLALDKLVADQQDRKSPQYHRWLTPGSYGARFGASDAAIAALSNWLESHGLQVGTPPAGRGHLPFTGDKEKIEAAFHTQIHQFSVDGERHYANVSDPMIPAVLKPTIAAIRGLNDFYPKPGVKPLTIVPRSARALAAPGTFYGGSGQYPGYVGPTDFATMYNLPPAGLPTGHHGRRCNGCPSRSAERYQSQCPCRILVRLRRGGFQFRPAGSAVPVRCPYPLPTAE